MSTSPNTPQTAPGESSLVKIRVMSGVASAIRTDRQLLRAMGVYYVLKAMYKSGYIKDLNSEISAIATACHRTEKTVRARLAILEQRGIVQIKTVQKKGKRTHQAVSFISSAELHKKLEIKQRVKFHYRRVIVSPEYILRAIEGAENYKAQEIKIHSKHEKAVKKQIAQRGWSVHNPNAAEAIAAEYARMRALFIKRQEPVHAGDEFYFNPDISFSMNSYRSRLGLKSKRSGHYWQYRLQQLGLVKVEPRRIESEAQCAGSILGTRFWNSQTETAFLVQRNKLHFFPAG